MKALILSISTGQGHHAVGAAIANTFESMGVSCTTMDAYEYVDPKLSKLLSKGYLISAAHAPRWLSSRAYNALVKKTSPSGKLSVQQLTSRYFAWDLNKFVQKDKPDIIVCTHVLSSIIVSVMRAHAWTDAITAGVVTDFTVHPLWEETRDIDYYVTPSELLDFQMARKGLDICKILPFGIPIKPQFSRKTDCDEARRSLGLDAGLPTVLLISGSMGHGGIDVSTERLDALSLDMQIMVVCGNNKEMYRKLKRKKFKKRFDIYGYVDYVDLMMDAADCIITKPGGITSSEALAKGLPMIMINPIPGHETRNAEFMLNNGIALYATNSFPLEEAVFSLFKHPDRLEDLRATIGLYAKKDASRRLCEFLAQKAEDRTAAVN
ncbi:MAG: glycosyltransferase [Clostridiales Family XIII bacterium]|jgi:processive 1,2-diacylglycerol beta-glucosyltransferase|nr:glycosyltransferase [Clostridiales Family XIII bacterium]